LDTKHGKNKEINDPNKLSKPNEIIVKDLYINEKEIKNMITWMTLYSEGLYCNNIDNKTHLPPFISFGMPQEVFENVDVWVHEFTEATIFYLIREEEANMSAINISNTSNGQHPCTLAHAVTSLVCISMYHGVGFINPDSFWELLNKKVLGVRGFNSW